MKTSLLSLAVVLSVSVASNASAGVFVHAGPVHVAVGAHSHHRPRPIFAVHPAPLPAAAPVVVHPQPILAPQPPVVVAPQPPAAAPNGNSLTSDEIQGIRDEARELRQEVRQAGSVVSRRERREIREERRELQRSIWQAVRD